MKIFFQSIFVVCMSISVFAAEPIGSIQRMRGKALVIRGNQELKAVADMPIHQGDKIKTEKESQVQIKIGLKALFVSQNAEMIVKTDPASKNPQDKDVNVNLLYGKIRAAVGGKPDGHNKLKVYTSTATAGIRGTMLDIAADRDTGATSVTGLEGGDKSLLLLEKGASEPKVVPPGTFTTAVAEGPSLEPTKIDPNQFEKIVNTFAGQPQKTALGSDGKIVELQQNLPVGVTDMDVAQPAPPFMQVGESYVPVPPKSIEFNPETKKYDVAPSEKTIVLTDGNDGSVQVMPVVNVPPPPSLAAKMELYTDKQYLGKLQESWKDQTESMKLQSEYVVAKMTGNAEPEKMAQLQTQMKKVEMENVNNQKDLLKLETQNFKEFVKEQYEDKLKNAPPAEKQDLQQKMEVAQKEIQLAETQAKVLETKMEVLTQAPAQQTPGAEPPPALAQKMETLRQLENQVAEKKGEVADGLKQMTMTHMQNVANQFKGALPGAEGDKMAMYIQDSSGKGFKAEMAVGPAMPPDQMQQQFQQAVGDRIFDNAAASSGFGSGMGMPPPMMMNAMMPAGPNGFPGGPFAGGPFPGGPQSPGMMPGMSPGMFPPGMMGMYPPGMMPDGRDPATGGFPPGMMPPGLPPGMTPEQFMQFVQNECSQNPSSPMCMGGGGMMPPPPPPACMPGDPMCGPPPPGGCSDPTAPGCYAGGFPPPPPGGCDPGDPACMPPPPPNGGYCPPGDPSCMPPPGSGDCALNPFQPACQGGPNDPCFFNPCLPQCGGGCAPPPPPATTTVQFNIHP